MPSAGNVAVSSDLSDAPAPRSEASTTVGVTGQSWRASVSSWGAVTPWRNAASPGADGPDPTLEWYIAADDRWHVPGNETAVRQVRIGGAPVTETRVRIPDGDAVQRVWSVAGAGGLTIIEIENDSPLPFAVAFSGIEVITERPPVDQPIQGIDLPDGTITLPVGHHASVRVAIPHSGEVRPIELSGAPDASVVANGWQTIAERASRLGLPDDGLSDAVVAARCDLMLEGPVDAAVDTVGFVLDVGELVRLGEDPEPWLHEIVVPLEIVARDAESDREAVLAALVAGERIALAAGDRRAARDITRLGVRVAKSRRAEPANELGPFSTVRRGASVGRFVHEVERRLARGTDLLPAGIPTAWLGANFELHGVPTSASSTVSIAVRWHGERPAVLWEQTGEAQRLTARAVDADWSTSDISGEGLWAAPARPAARSQRLSLAVDDAPAAPVVAGEPVPTSPAPAPTEPVIDESGSTSFS